MEMMKSTLDDFDLDSTFIDKFATYLHHVGWTHLDHPNSRIQLFQGPPADDEQPLQLVLPSDIKFQDSRIRIAEALGILTITEDASFDSLLQEIISVDLDTPRPLNDATLSESETIQERAKPDWINLNEIVTGVIEMLAPTLDEKIQVISNLDPSLKTIQGDPEQIRQVIWNLIANARDAIRSAGTVTVETANSEKDPSIPPGSRENHVTLLVKDTGVGIDKVTQQRIFEPFFTTKERGIGLGLSVSRAIVEQHGGHITVESTPNVGSVVRLKFPDVTRRPPNVGVGTILLVQRVKLLRELLRESLEAGGYTVLEASGVEEAERLSGKYPENIDLLLSDMLTGPKLVHELRKQRPEMKGLFLSAKFAPSPDEIDERDLLLDIEQELGTGRLSSIVRKLIVTE